MAWGLLGGFGKGLTSIGEDRAEQLKQQRLQEFQKELLKEERDYKDKVRMDDREYQAGLLTAAQQREDFLTATKRLYDEEQGNVKHKRDIELQNLKNSASGGELSGLTSARITALKNNVDNLGRAKNKLINNDGQQSPGYIETAIRYEQAVMRYQNALGNEYTPQVPVDEELMFEAESEAGQLAEQKAKYENSDAEDFAETGGSREAYAKSLVPELYKRKFAEKYGHLLSAENTTGTGASDTGSDFEAWRRTRQQGSNVPAPETAPAEKPAQTVSTQPEPAVAPAEQPAPTVTEQTKPVASVQKKNNSVEPKAKRWLRDEFASLDVRSENAEIARAWVEENYPNLKPREKNRMIRKILEENNPY